MFEKSYDAVVNYALATSAEKIDQVFSRLSRIVAIDLGAELDIAGEMHRYDAVAKRAYYFERQGTNLAVWTRNEVHRFHEAGELLTLIVASKVCFDENEANKSARRTQFGRRLGHRLSRQFNTFH